MGKRENFVGTDVSCLHFNSLLFCLSACLPVCLHVCLLSCLELQNLATPSPVSDIASTCHTERRKTTIEQRDIAHNGVRSQGVKVKRRSQSSWQKNDVLFQCLQFLDVYPGLWPFSIPDAEFRISDPQYNSKKEEGKKRLTYLSCSQKNLKLFNFLKST